MSRSIVFFVAVALALPSVAEAIDHKNLEGGHPLRLEDAYAIADGEIAIEAGAGVVVPRRGRDRGVLPLELQYGAMPNLQLGVGTTLSTDPREVDEPPFSGDVRLSALYNFNQETLSLPAFGVKVEVALPTGVGSRGADVGVIGVVTRSIQRLSLHLNAGYEVLTDAARDERDGR